MKKLVKIGAVMCALAALALTACSGGSDDEPSVPSVPVQPENPGSPDSPDVPENPDVPEDPDTPDVPDNPEPEKPLTVSQLLSRIVSSYEGISLDTITITPESLKTVADIYPEIEAAASSGKTELDIRETIKAKIRDNSTLCKAQETGTILTEKSGEMHSFSSDCPSGLVFSGTFDADEISFKLGESVIANFQDASFESSNVMLILVQLQYDLNLTAVSNYNSDWLPELNTK